MFSINPNEWRSEEDSSSNSVLSRLFAAFMMVGPAAGLAASIWYLFFSG
jgi:hypothetical protein